MYKSGPTAGQSSDKERSFQWLSPVAKEKKVIKEKADPVYQLQNQTRGKEKEKKEEPPRAKGSHPTPPLRKRSEKAGAVDSKETCQ